MSGATWKLETRNSLDLSKKKRQLGRSLRLSRDFAENFRWILRTVAVSLVSLFLFVFLFAVETGKVARRIIIQTSGITVHLSAVFLPSFLPSLLPFRFAVNEVDGGGIFDSPGRRRCELAEMSELHKAKQQRMHDTKLRAQGWVTVICRLTLRMKSYVELSLTYWLAQQGLKHC